MYVYMQSFLLLFFLEYVYSVFDFSGYGLPPQWHWPGQVLGLGLGSGSGFSPLVAISGLIPFPSPSPSNGTHSSKVTSPLPVRFNYLSAHTFHSYFIGHLCMLQSAAYSRFLRIRVFCSPNPLVHYIYQLSRYLRPIEAAVVQYPSIFSTCPVPQYGCPKWVLRPLCSVYNPGLSQVPIVPQLCNLSCC